MVISGVCGVRTLGLVRLPFSPENPCLQSSPFFLTHSRRLFVSLCSASKTTTKSEKKERVIVISGPTGAGKSRLALELAKRLNGEIISADSVQVYQGLDVGSAKPSTSDRKEVLHHLVDILHPSEEYSVGQFFEDARQTTRDILNRGRVPIVTGGTGLYLRWFIYGKPDVPKASPAVASEVCSELMDLQRDGDWDAAVQLVVKAGDPKAQSLAANDWYRLRRRLEIIKSSGSPPSSFQVPYDSFREDSSVSDHSHGINSSAQERNAKDLDYDFICFFLSSQRLDLYRLIDFRCEDMLSGGDGILSESRWLLDLGLLPNSNSATRAIGYRQIGIHSGVHSRTKHIILDYHFIHELLISGFHKGSAPMLQLRLCGTVGFARNFAKRQMTWFRNEHIYHWLDASRPLEEVINFIHDAYHDQTGPLVVPESLRMTKEMSNRKDISALKVYRPKNRHFINREDCSDILEWIRRTQG